MEFKSCLRFRFNHGCDDWCRSGNCDRCLSSGNCAGLAQKVKQVSFDLLFPLLSELLHILGNKKLTKWWLFPHCRKRILRKNSDSTAATQMSPPVPTYGTGLQAPDGEYSTGVIIFRDSIKLDFYALCSDKLTRQQWNPFWTLL